METIEKEKAEMLLAEIIGNLYTKYEPNFCDYKNETHKLGWFKEQIKHEFHDKLMEQNTKEGEGETYAMELSFKGQDIREDGKEGCKVEVRLIGNHKRLLEMVSKAMDQDENVASLLKAAVLINSI